jgi:hypothetical protein
MVSDKMRYLFTILFFFSFTSAFSQLNLIGYVKDGGTFVPSDGCSQTNISIAVYGSARFGQLPAGMQLFLDAGGTSHVVGNSHWFGFTTTINTSATRRVQIDATGFVVNAYSACASEPYPLVTVFKSTTATSNCGNNNFIDSIFFAVDDPTMYNFKPAFLSRFAMFFPNGSYTASYKANGPATWKFDVVGGTSSISNITYCFTTPAVDVDQDFDVYLPTPTILLTAKAIDPNGIISSYSWARTSGPNTPTILNPAGTTTGITGVVAGNYVFRCTVTDNDGNTAFDEVTVTVHPAPRCTNPRKIDITDSVDWINLTGYISAFSPLFDGTADPLNGVDGTANTLGNETYPVPLTGEKFADYYDRSKGWRYDFDLRQEYYIYQVSIYWRATGSDTARVFMGDSLFNGGPDAFARLRNINSQVPTITSNNSPNVFEWKHYRVDDSTRHVRLQIKNAWFGGNPFPDGGITNFILYGCPIASAPPIYTLKQKPVKLGAKTGFNIATQIAPVATKFKKQKVIREYPQKNWFDDQNIAYPNNAFNPAFFGGDGGHAYNDSVKNGMSMTLVWPAMLGTSQWMMNTYGVGMGYADLDSINVDPEDPSSYERHADMAWNWMKIYCASCTVPAVDTPFMRQHNYAALNGGRKVYNRNEFNGYEDDNERSGWFQLKKLNPVAEVAQASAVKDGDQGRLHDQWGGNRMGIKNADPTAKFIMDGTVGIDVEEIKARVYCSKMLRGEVMWDIVQGHQYWSRFDDPIATATTNGQINNWGTFPEDDSARYQYDNMVYWGNRIANDTITYITGEHGTDGTFWYPHTADEVTATRTQYGAPQYTELGATALDSAQAQAIAIEQGLISIWKSNLKYGVQYLAHDLTPPTDLPGYLNSYVSSGYFQHDLTPKKDWYRMLSMMNIAEEYYLDSTLSEALGDVIHYRGHRIDNPDWVIDVVYQAVLNTGAGIDVNINVHDAPSADIWTASYTSETGSSSTATPLLGIVTVKATVTPRYVISLQSNGGGNLPDVPPRGGLLYNIKENHHLP